MHWFDLYCAWLSFLPPVEHFFKKQKNNNRMLQKKQPDTASTTRNVPSHYILIKYDEYDDRFNESFFKLFTTLGFAFLSGC